MAGGSPFELFNIYGMRVQRYRVHYTNAARRLHDRSLCRHLRSSRPVQLLFQENTPNCLGEQGAGTVCCKVCQAC